MRRDHVWNIVFACAPDLLSASLISSPRSKSQIFIWMQKLSNAKGGWVGGKGRGWGQHQRMHIYKKTPHVSNHTLALTVSTEIYCTLEMDVHQKRRREKKMDVQVVDVLEKKQPKMQ